MTGGVIRTGIVLPTFRETPADALRRRTRPSRPVWTACSATTTSGPWASPTARPWPPSRSSPSWPRATASGEIPTTPGGRAPVGTLVARVGLAPNGILLGQFRALHLLAPGRIIAGLGTGDRLSEAENRAYGIPFPPAASGGRRWSSSGSAVHAPLASLCGWAGGPGGSGHRGGGGRGGAQSVGRRCGPGGQQGPRPRGGGGDLGRAGAAQEGSDSREQEHWSWRKRAATWAIFGWPIDPAALAAAARGAGEATAPGAGAGGSPGCGGEAGGAGQAGRRSPSPGERGIGLFRQREVGS